VDVLGVVIVSLVIDRLLSRGVKGAIELARALDAAVGWNVEMIMKEI